MIYDYEKDNGGTREQNHQELYKENAKDSLLMKVLFYLTLIGMPILCALLR